MMCSCPECGNRSSVTVFISDIYSRQLGKILAELPRPVGMVVLEYISLFRPAKRSLCWGRVLRLLEELSPHIQTNIVWRNGNNRPTSTEIWAEAMQQMLDQRDTLTRPLKSHGYLYEVVFRMADKQAAAAERKHEKNLRSSSAHSGGPALASKTIPHHLQLNTLRGELDSLTRLNDASPNPQLAEQIEKVKEKITNMELPK
ncbi:MAG: hypothetical protein ACN4GR_16295 [Arenicellales bacterium]